MEKITAWYLIKQKWPDLIAATLGEISRALGLGFLFHIGWNFLDYLQNK